MALDRPIARTSNVEDEEVASGDTPPRRKRKRSRSRRARTGAPLAGGAKKGGAAGAGATFDRACGRPEGLTDGRANRIVCSSVRLEIANMSIG